MSLCYDGDHSFAGDPSSLYKEKIEDSSFGGKKGPSIEAAFRGFEKLPVVLAERIDITPYLSKTSVGAEPGNKTTGINLSSFFNKCSVSVARVDLERLRDSLSIKSWDSDDSAMGSVNNMSNVQCNICGKVYSSEKKLHNHQENKHMIVYKPQKPKPLKRVSFSDKVIVHEVMVYHKCRKCTKIFEDYKSLKAHKKQKHKKRKCYICNYCAKKFVDRMFFKVHIKLHCEVCSLLLPNKAQYLDHKRNVCRVIKLHKCKTCDKSFFKFMDLKDHSHEHVNEYYVCDICKDQCPTQCALGHHIAFLHSEQRPNTLYEMRALGNERLYLCNFCEESSVDRKLIENHVQLLPDLTNRAMTGYEDYYFCDQCLKKFSMESEMLQHKWTHFLKTSDNSQERPKGILVNKNNATKITYRVNEEIPQCFQPKVVLEKLKVGGKLLTETVAFVDVNSFDVHNGDIKKPVVHPKSKKTIISKHQCQNCGKYYSSNYSLNRHLETQHTDYENLRCKMCEETFVWPSLLQRHKCIRANLPEMPFQDARPEIHFDNLHEITNFDGLNLEESEDYENRVDFEIPEPIVELTEYGRYSENIVNGHSSQPNSDSRVPLQSIGYKVVMQEVPIEF